VAEAGISKQKLGQAAKKPNTLARMEHEDTFSGPSLFEWGESSTNVNKPKQVWVPKIEGLKRSRGPFKEHNPNNAVEAVEDLDIS
jgi:hypothetical protein